jgi:hypothetical protein
VYTAAVRMGAVDDTMKEEAKSPAPGPPTESEDDRRAAAAAVNRKRALEDWEEKKKQWRSMGVPKGLPAKK